MHFYKVGLIIISILFLSYGRDQLISDSLHTENVEITNATTVDTLGDSVCVLVDGNVSIIHKDSLRSSIVGALLPTVEPDTIDTIVFLEDGVLKRASKCDGTFPPQAHYHTTDFIIGFNDSLSEGVPILQDEPYRIMGTNIDTEVVTTDIIHNQATLKTTFPGNLSRDSSDHLIISIETTTGNDDKVIVINPANAVDSTRSPRIAIVGSDNVENGGEIIASLGLLDWFKILGGSFEVTGSDVRFMLGGGTGHRINMAAGAVNINNIIADKTADSELHLHAGGGNGLGIVPHRIEVDDSLFIAMVASQNSLSQTLTSSVQLVNSVETGMFEIAIGAGEMVGGVFDYTIYVTGGSSDLQSNSGSVSFNGINKSGTVTSDVLSLAESEVVSDGTLVNTFTITNGSGKITVNCTATTSLSTPTINILYNITLHSLNAITEL